MTILVTGASGFIGSALVRLLVAQGHALRLLCRANSKRPDFGPNAQIQWVIGDLNDATSIDNAINGCTGIYHVAADYRLWVPDPQTMYQTNVRGTRTIMEAALKHRVQRIVYTSSVVTLGRVGDYLVEDIPATIDEKKGHYVRSKFLAEAQIRQMIRDQGLPAVIVNPTGPVGIGDNIPTPTGQMIIDAANGTLPGYFRCGINFADVEDIAMGHVLAYEHGQIGRNYILGSENMMLGDFLNLVAKHSGRRRPMLCLPVPVMWPAAYLCAGLARLTGLKPFVTPDGLMMMRKMLFCHHQRATDELGYQPGSVDLAVAKAVAWFRAQGMVS